MIQFQMFDHQPERCEKYHQMLTDNLAVLEGIGSEADFEKYGAVKFDRPAFLTTHKKHIRHNGIPNSSATIYLETERSVSEYEKTKNHNSFTHNGALCIGCFKWLCGKRGKPDGTQPVNYQLNAF